MPYVSSPFSVFAQTSLSLFLEERINRIVQEYIQDEARILRCPVDKVEQVPRLTLRVMATRYDHRAVHPLLQPSRMRPPPPYPACCVKLSLTSCWPW
jgi:hypothetical protein